MGDRRAERSLGGALGVDVDPLRIVGRRCEGVDALLRHLDPRRRPELDADEVAEPAHCAASAPARSRVSDVSLPRSSRLS